MEKKFVEDFFGYAAIILLSIIVAFFALTYLGYEMIAINVAIIGALTAIIFALTGWLFHKHLNNQKIVGKRT
jgi:uncharacterized membrane protein YdjX (TVP38/TMEM64 family)